MGLVRTLYEVLHEVIFASLKKWLCQGWNTCKNDKEPVPRLKAKEIGGGSVSLFLQIWEECTHTRASSGDEPVGIKMRTADCGLRTTDCTQSAGYKTRTRYKMRTRDYNPGQNYLRKFSPTCPLSYATKLFQNDAFVERKPLPPIQCCFPQTSRDQALFWIHNNIAFRGRGRGKNRYSYENAVQVYNFFNSFFQDCTDWTEYKTRTRYKTRTTDCVFKTALERLLRETGQAD